MKKRIYWILLAVLLIAVCVIVIANRNSRGDNAVTTEDKTGFSGGVLYGSETQTESAEEPADIVEEQETDQSTEVNNQDIDAASNQNESADEEQDVAETISQEKVPEENEGTGPIKDNTDYGDLLEPPANGSDGVL